VCVSRSAAPALTRRARRCQLRSGTVQTFNAAGAPLGKFLWDRTARLVAFGWTEDEVCAPARRALCRARQRSCAHASRRVALTLPLRQVLLCVADDGGVYPYSVDGELLPWQLSMGAECATQRVAEACVLPTGVVVLTHEAQLFAVRTPALTHARLCIAADRTRLLPPPMRQVTNFAEPRVQRFAEVPPLEAFPHAFAGATCRAALRELGVRG
jgi:hypothetical protein